MKVEWKVGDRVRMRAPDRYIWALRRLAERDGTVTAVWVPMGSNRTSVRVDFDVARKGAKPMSEVFSPEELVPATTHHI